MSYSIKELYEKISEINVAITALSAYPDRKSYLKCWSLSARKTYYLRRIAALERTAHKTEREALDLPFVPSGNPAVDAITLIQRRRHEARKAKAIAKPIAPMHPVTLPAHIATPPTEVDADEEFARIEALLPAEDRMP